MKKLERLRLHNTEITNAGLQYLSALPALRRLYLDGTRVTDEGVASLNLSGFETLSLAGTAITDDVLESVSASESLDSIDVSDTQVTGAGLTRLAGMPSLHGHNVTHSRMKKNGNSPTLKALCQVLRRQEF